VRHALLRDRRTEDVLEERLAALLVEASRARRRVQREPIERDAERSLEHHRAMRERQRASPPLGTGGRRRARDRRRGEARKNGALARVALRRVRVRVAVVEKTPTTKVLRHPIARPLEHPRDVARREVRQRAERELVAGLLLVPIDAVEERGVHMRVEAQRLKLASELTAGMAHEPTVYVLDEPTTGLHLSDVGRLVKVLDGLVDRGDTLVIIEHHPDVIANADWVVELGPEAGDAGGTIVFEGEPAQLKKRKTTTGRALGKLAAAAASAAE
jgi:ABC-type histidine transport system ATPase subunit